MPVELFMEFVDRKQRESIRHLKIMEKMFQKHGLQVKSHIDDDNPYVFVQSNNKQLSFDGIRIYEIGDTLAYRVSKEEKTEPYGKAYALNLEEMFNDLMGENDVKEEEAGKKVIEGVLNEIKKFFDRSAQAEKDLKNSELDNQILLRTGGTDYSSLVFNKS